MNIDYRYTISERKVIPKTVKLKNEIIVKSMDFESATGTVLGKRILIGGTTETADNSSRPFLAVFNTRHNVTEFIWEEQGGPREVVKGIEADIINTQGEWTLTA